MYEITSREYKEMRNKIRDYVERDEYGKAEKAWEQILESKFKQTKEDLRSAASFYSWIHKPERVIFILNEIIENDPEIGDVQSFLHSLRPYMRQYFNRVKFGYCKNSIIIACKILEKDSFNTLKNKEMINNFHKWIGGDLILPKNIYN